MCFKRLWSSTIHSAELVVIIIIVVVVVVVVVIFLYYLESILCSK